MTILSDIIIRYTRNPSFRMMKGYLSLSYRDMGVHKTTLENNDVCERNIMMYDGLNTFKTILNDFT